MRRKSDTNEGKKRAGGMNTLEVPYRRLAEVALASNKDYSQTMSAIMTLYPNLDENC